MATTEKALVSRDHVWIVRTRTDLWVYGDWSALIADYPLDSAPSEDSAMSRFLVAGEVDLGDGCVATFHPVLRIA